MEMLKFLIYVGKKLCPETGRQRDADLHVAVFPEVLLETSLLVQSDTILVLR
jgi:hypothetical protein